MSFHWISLRLQSAARARPLFDNGLINVLHGKHLHLIKIYYHVDYTESLHVKKSRTKTVKLY